MTDHLPDVVLERYRLQEMTPADRATIAARIARDPDLRARLASLDESDAALGAETERIARRLPAPAATIRRRPLIWVMPVAVAAAALAIVVIARSTPPAPASLDRIKGAEIGAQPGLALYRRTADGSERLADGAIARPGDVIRVGYHAAGRAYGAIVSIDGRGAVTMHLPSDGTRAAALQSASTVLLDKAYELDDAPKWERFYFVAGASPFELGAVVAAVRAAAQSPAAAHLPLPAGLDQSTFTLQKESGR